MQPFVIHGNFIWTTGPNELHKREQAFGVCDADGRCAGVFPSLPEAYKSLSVRDLGQALIVPGYSDLHLHAAQYRDLGLGMDLQLLDWLQELTYPEEARFKDLDHARTVYSEFARELRAGFTTRAAIFASAHREGTEVLMDILEPTGLKTMVGLVDMDRNAPDYIRQPDADTALRETRQWLAEVSGKYQNTQPILTPRFVPSCTMPVLEGLGEIHKTQGIPVQSHLDESPEEIAWVRELCPGYDSYADVYDKTGLLGPDVIMAHCIYLSEEEQDLLKQRGTFIAHCPGSNTNVRSGTAPIRRYLDQGLSIGLGTDISGGNSLDHADTVRDALSVSRFLWRTEGLPHLRAEEAFYLATAGGGAYFGDVGQFEPGYEFDAVAVYDCAWRRPEDDLETRLQKMIYLAHSRDVTAKYVSGRILF